MGAATVTTKAKQRVPDTPTRARGLMRSADERGPDRAARVAYQHWVTEGDHHRFLLCPSCGDLLADFSVVSGMLRLQTRQCGHVLLVYDCSTFETDFTVVHDPEDLFDEVYDSLGGAPSRAHMEWALRQRFDRDQVAIIRIDSLPFAREDDLADAELHRTVVVQLSPPQGRPVFHPLGRVDFTAAETHVTAAVGAALPELQMEECNVPVEPDQDLVKRCVAAMPGGVRQRLASDPAAWSHVWDNLFAVSLERSASHAARLLSEATGVQVTEADLEERLLRTMRPWWAEIVRDWFPTAVPRLLPLATGLDKVDLGRVVSPDLIWECLAGRERLAQGAAARLDALSPDRWH